MKRLPLPHRRVRSVIETCSAGKIQIPAQQVLRDSIERLEAEEDLYLAAGRAGRLSSIQASSDALAHRTISVYEQRILPVGSLGRPIYEELRFSSPGDMCPFCNAGFVKELDHFLPKGSFGNLAATPANLVPICRDCNREKLTYVPTSDSDVLFHPYFDNFEDVLWLRTIVVETDPMTFYFEVDSDAVEDHVLLGRINSHFKALDLSDFYTWRAGDELSGKISDLQRLRNGPDGQTQLRTSLCKDLETTEADLPRNHWKCALYRSLSASDWFIDIGVLNLIRF